MTHIAQHIQKVPLAGTDLDDVLVVQKEAGEFAQSVPLFGVEGRYDGAL